MGKKLTFKEVKKYFEDRDCELLEKEYKGIHIKMKYRCDCGNEECKICFNNFKQGKRCMECSGSKKYTYKEVYKYFEECGCELLEKEYKGVHIKMRYRCNCKNISKINFSNFKKGQRCRKCSGCEKYTYEEVKQYFKEHNCKLLETEYINANILMKYICSCGNPDCKIRFSNFKQGNRCKKCGAKRTGIKLSYTFDYVYNYFKEHNCELFETKYVNEKNKMRYRCNCGNTKCKISFGNFKKGQRCRKCSGCEKLTFKFVKQYFKDNDCKLLETEYINNSTLMEYECSCGNDECKICFASFKNGSRCIECSGSKKLTFEFVYNYFKEHDCKLLETEYVNSSTKMKYECKCGNDKSSISFSYFRRGRRCMECAKERRKQTMLKKYGVSFFSSTNGGGYSKESQKLFDIIYKKIDKKYKEKTYFATLNKEFGIKYNDKGFKYDFVNSRLKKAIEYNGSVFHPQSHQKDDEIGWFAFDKNKTVKEARLSEKIKYEGLEKQGYKILTVWDYELHKDFDTLVQKCLDFLLN